MNNDPTEFGPQQPPAYEQPGQYIPPGQPPPYNMPPLGQYMPPGPQQPPQYMPPGQYPAAPPMSGYPAQPMQQRKSSLRWLWITLAIVGGLIVLGCAACAITAALGIGFFASTVIAPSTAANAYYQAIENKDYSKAYSYFDSASIVVQGRQLSQQAFTLAAQLRDTANGPVTSFRQTGIQTTNSTATITISVTRSRQTYDVQLQLKQVGNDWKIIGANNI